jgi:hypothetical protein
MSIIVTRSGKGSPLTHTEVDDNFSNLNNDKAEVSSLSDVATSGSYNDLTEKPTIGTMAQQDDTAVDINGGAIDGAIVGAVTPAAGTFTTLSTGTLSTGTLTATGQTSLGGAAGSESVFIAQDATSGQNSLHLFGGAASGASGARVAAAGSATNINLNLGSKGTSGVIRMFTNVPSVTGTWSTYQMAVSHTSSAVNYVQVTGAATGGFPVISLQGSDATVSGWLTTKGSGAWRLMSGSGSYTQLRIDGTQNAVNSFNVFGSVAGQSPVFGTQGNDTNISQVFQSKGTGAIDLAAGSRGVNISNGGTVTAITRTANGSGYTSIPSVAISAPTTAGGVQATATVNVFANTATIGAGGTGYTVNDVLTVVGGTPAGSAATYTVTAVSGGVVTAVSALNFGSYSVIPTSPVATTGGTGSGATLNLTYGISGTFTITNAGSGYVEQPTVTFSGGGGSGAAAYATVGSGSIIRSLGSTGTQSLSFYTPMGEVLRLRDTGLAGAYMLLNTTASGVNFLAQGATNATLGFNSNGTSQIDFGTNGNSGNTQLRVSHTASAVNYVQVTGGATSAQASITAQGSDTNVTLGLSAKGANTVSFYTNNNGSRQAAVIHTAGTVANYATLTGNVAGSAPAFGVAGSDTNIDLTLTPKGTGNVRFGTFTSNADTPITGYITIKDSSGTTRKLAVIA